jgi:hypothetical protein
VLIDMEGRETRWSQRLDAFAAPLRRLADKYEHPPKQRKKAARKTARKKR